MPKVNMYQSLHTTVIGPKGDPVEIQIRTYEMHRIAEEGIAAHWLYKEKKSDRDKFDAAFTWLRQLLESQKDVNDPREYLDTVRLDLFPDEVYVFTPKGDVKALPGGLDADRLRVRRPYRRRSPLRRRQGQRQARAAALHAAPGRHRRGRRLPDPASEPRLAQDRQVDPGALEDQPVAQDRGARPLARARARAVRARGEEVPPVADRDTDRVRRDAEAPHRARLPVVGRSARVRADMARRRCNRSWASSRPRWSTRPTAAPSPGRRRSPRKPTAPSRSAGSTTSWSGSPSAARRCPGTASWASSRAAAASPCTRAIA